jgi:hypothetical protein
MNLSGFNQGWDNKMNDKKNSRRSYTKNIGRPGVVYILSNPGLAAGFYKIGCSGRSGQHRANDLNKEASTGTPGMFKCIFECKTEDCGKAEQSVFRELKSSRKGKRGQEYFEIDLKLAKETITRACTTIDLEIVKARISAQQPSFTSNSSSLRNLDDKSPLDRMLDKQTQTQRDKATKPPAIINSETKNSSLRSYIFVTGAIALSFWLYERNPFSTPQFVSTQPAVIVIKEREAEPRNFPHLTDQGGEKAYFAELETASQSNKVIKNKNKTNVDHPAQALDSYNNIEKIDPSSKP